MLNSQTTLHIFTKKMEVLYQDHSLQNSSWIKFYTEDLPHFIVPWHYHPEIEIMYITEGYGTRYVGDHIGGYEVGDICMVGPNLQHEWKNDPAFFEKGTSLRAVCKVLFFRKEIFDSNIEHLTEMAEIGELLERSKRGILFLGESRKRIEQKINQVYPLTGIARITGLIELLYLMATEKEYKLLTSVGFTESVNSKDFFRFNKIYEYMVANYRSRIALEDVAALIGLTPQAFCKYFKERTKTTFVNYLNNMRIGYAKKMLIEGKHKISVICTESGFNNQSHFIKQFRNQTGMLPREYQEKHGIKSRIVI